MDRIEGRRFDDSVRMLEQAQAGDAGVLNELFARHRGRLRRMVQLRLDSRLNGRIDASDVVQEAHLQAARRLDEYLRDPAMPFFLWLRLLVAEQLLVLHRHHLNVRMRDARREVALYPGAAPEASSQALAAHLLGRETSPSDAALRAERLLRLQAAINCLSPLDREILALRHFEQLTRSETAGVLGIAESAAAKRYIRALARLKDHLGGAPGGLEGL
jgi:RNA polymerase sigma-70 factor (ECF subfamily)